MNITFIDVCWLMIGLCFLAYSMAFFVGLGWFEAKNQMERVQQRHWVELQKRAREVE